MRWQVRDAAPEDAAAVVALIRRFTAEEGNPPGRLTPDAFVTLSFGAEVRFRTKLVEVGGEILGYALFYPSYDTDHGAKGAYLQDLYVLPEARGQGIGRALMHAVVRACRDDGGRYLFWNALVSNHAGRAFYRRIGAREEPVVTCSLQPDAFERLARDI
jgi:ribosomal protein S18 acetylase RimI-like enzyme